MSPTIYGKNSQKTATEWCERLHSEVVEGAASGITGNWTRIGLPWDRFTVEAVDPEFGGWAAFVEERNPETVREWGTLAAQGVEVIG